MKKQSEKKWQKYMLVIVLIAIIALVIIILFSKDKKAGSEMREEETTAELILSEEQFVEGIDDMAEDKDDKTLIDSKNKSDSLPAQKKTNSENFIDKIKEFFVPENDSYVNGSTNDKGLIVDKKDENNSENEKVPSDQDSGEEKGELEIKEKIDASYEEYLAAGMVAAISMQYPDFEIQKIYLTGKHSLENKMNSKGAYVVFETGGKQIAVQSYALENERQERGTIDLYTMDLGFSVFDTMNADLIDVEKCENVDLYELNDLIAQSLLVSLYEH